MVQSFRPCIRVPGYLLTTATKLVKYSPTNQKNNLQERSKVVTVG